MAVGGRKADKRAPQKNGNGHAPKAVASEAEPLLHLSPWNDVTSRLLFDKNPLAMFVFDRRDLRFLDVNAAAIQQYGYKRHEFLALKLTDIRPSSEVSRLLGTIQNYPGGLKFEGQWKHRRKNREIFDVDITSHSLEFAGHDAILTIAQDITAHKQAEERIAEHAAYLNALTENNPLAIVVLDSQGRVQMCNPAFERLFQFRQTDILGADLDGLVTPDSFVSQATALSRRASAGEVVRATVRRKKRDGTPIDVQVTGVPLIVNGMRIGSFGMYEDITERRRAEDELRHTEAKYRALVEQLPAITYIAEFGPDGAWFFVSPQIHSLLGFTPAEWTADSKSWYNQLHPEDRDRTLAQEQQSRRTGEPLDSEYRMFTRDARVLWFRDRATVVRDASGGDPYMQGVMLDVTAHKEAELAQHAAEERFRSLFENAVEGIFQSTPDGRYLSVNPAHARMCGFSSPAEQIASVHDIAQLYADPECRQEFKRIMAERGQVENFEYQVLRKDGTKVWVSENARAVPDSSGNILYYEGTAEDITERKRAEAERQVTFEIIHGVNVTENLDDLLHLIHQSLKKVLDADNCFVALYAPSTGMFHFPFFVDEFDSAPPPQKVGRSCTAYVFHTGRAMLIPQKVFDQLAQQGEVELVGTPAPSWLGVPLRTPAETIGVLVIQHYRNENAYTERDLEFLSSVGGQIALAIDRKRAEAALRDSEQRFRVLIEQLPAVLWTVSQDLRFTSCLGAGLGRLGLKPNQAVGMSLLDFFETSDPSFMPIAAHRRAITGEPVTFHIEWRGGSYACHVEPLRDADSRIEGAICMALDVTDRKKLEEQLRQAQKMEAVGRLAGGIAHDFNNLLMVIQGYAELLLDRLGENNPLRRNAEQIQEASQRATALTRQLLAFSRKQMLAPTVLNVQHVVTDMEKILRRLIGEDIELLTVAPPGLWKVKADRSQIEQVILNLAVNSRDAMPRGGQLTIETGNVEFDNSYNRSPAILAPGRYVMLAVSDNGCGMDPETQAHIFEPFFTTKEKGKGTGLGLATVYGIVKQSGGYIWVYSEPGRGTSFKVYLPRVEETEDVKASPAEIEDLPRGSETILLVEDEKGVRELAREYLERNGYSVLEAEDAQAAIDIAQQHSGPIHLLMTDVIMPGLSGRELAEKMAALRPGIKVIYMSGYTDQSIVHHGILEPDTVLLQKPFTWNTLACKLRETLGYDKVPS
jgi:two-component system cell cycle sensor histidine kinase/response regulator CckA